MQRSVSYGELADLDAMFDEQVLAMGIQFEDSDMESQCRNDFVDQYINGDDEPKINLMS